MTAVAGQDWSADLARGVEPLGATSATKKKGKRAPVPVASEPAPKKTAKPRAAKKGARK